MHRRVRHLNPAQCGAQIALDARFITGVADGAAVSSWPARANSTISASQGTPANQPLFRAYAIGGRPAVDFDGSNDFLDLSAGALSLTNNVGSADLIAVCVQDASSDDGNCVIVSLSTGGGVIVARAAILGRNLSTDGVYSLGRRLDADTNATTLSAGALTSAVIAESRQRWSSGNTLAALNGVQTATVNYSSGSGNTSATDSSFARIGSNGLSDFNGKVAAVVVGVPAYSDAVRRRIRHSLGFSFCIATH